MNLKIGLLILLLAAMSCCPGLEKRQTLYDNGQVKEQWTVKMDADGNYIDHGEYIAWHENGQKKQIENWSEGKLEGHFMTWHENGYKMQEGEYKDGKMDCVYMEWNPRGQKIIEGKMVAGKQEGKWTYWDDNGNIYKQEDYKDGELVE